MILLLARRIVPAAVLAAVFCTTAGAQGYPPGGGGQNPVCGRLESQLMAVERGGADPTRADQIRRYEDQANKQQYELDRMVAHARRQGCEGSGFFSLFGGQSQQCGQINNQIQQMRANLGRMLGDLQQLQGGGAADREGQRRAIMAALSQNDCGPQYRSATAQPRGFFDSLFGPQEPGPEGGVAAPSGITPSGNYRTICVRTCDGFYYPISFSATPSKFRDDEQTCQRMCPAGEVALYAHRNPGEDVSQAVSTNGRPYTELPNAFAYRKAFNPSCTCKLSGQTWADAVKDQEDRIERGDIVVTEERAKAMSQPRDQQGRQQRGARPDPANANPPSVEATAQPPAQETAGQEPAPAQSGKRTIRTVGPTFYPVR